MTMRGPKRLFLLSIVALAFGVYGQESYVFDQQSGDESSITETSASLGNGPQVSQSFTPALASVDFVDLKLMQGNPGDGLESYVDVRLRADSPYGAILGWTPLTRLSDGFYGYARFRFSTTVAVVPGSIYFLEVSLGPGQGASWMGDYGLQYAGGAAYTGVTPWVGNDFWFREGIIVVPEPCGLGLLAMGLVALGCWAQPRRSP